MILCWAAKGGSGTTVVACALALLAARRGPATLVDLAGDVPTALGGPPLQGPGVSEWLVSASADTASLTALAAAVTDTLAVITRGDAPRATPDDERLGALVAAVQAMPQPVVDAGTGRPSAAWLAAATSSLLVTRPCFLALRNATATAACATGVVLVDEPGRALRARDVEQALGVPVVATIALDPAVARAVDAGMLLARLPHGLRQQLRGVA